MRETIAKRLRQLAQNATNGFMPYETRKIYKKIKRSYKRNPAPARRAIARGSDL